MFIDRWQMLPSCLSDLMWQHLFDVFLQSFNKLIDAFDCHVRSNRKDYDL